MVQTKSSNSVVLGAIAALLVVLAVAAVMFLSRGGSEPAAKRGDASPAAAAFAALDSGNLGQAEQAFQGLVDGGKHAAKGYEGLAAVALQKNDVQNAQHYAQEALKADSGAAYPHVVLGTLAMNQGDNAGAMREFQTATQQPNGEVWQKSEAFNRLGRLYAAGNSNQDAAAAYAKATELNPKNAEAFSNLGVLEKRMGNLDKAMAALQTSAQLNPQDAVSNRLLASVKDSVSASSDQNRLAAIDKQVAEMKAQFASGQVAAAKEPAGDGWTSGPLNVAFVDFESKGAGMRDGEEEFLLAEIINQSQEKGRVKIIEREMLGQLLSELNLNKSDLADKETALKIGKLVGAKMISTGKLARYEGETQLSLRMIETETSRIPVALTKVFEGNPKITEIAGAVSTEIVEKLRKNYPLHGLIVDVGPTVTLNIGAEQGVTMGTVFQALQEQEIKDGGKVLDVRLVPVAELEVTEVLGKVAMAKVLSGSDQLKKSMKVAQK